MAKLRFAHGPDLRGPTSRSPESVRENREDQGLDPEVRGARTTFRLSTTCSRRPGSTATRGSSRSAPDLRRRAHDPRQAGHGHPGPPGPASRDAGEGDLDALPPLRGPLPVRCRPRLVCARIRGDWHPDRGAREADRRAHRGRAASPVQAQRELPRPLLPLRRRDHRSEAAQAAGRVGVGRIPGPGSGRARRAEARHHGGGADRARWALDLAMLGEAGVGEARLGGSPASRRPDGAGPEAPHVRSLQLHAPRGDGEARAGGDGRGRAARRGDARAEHLQSAILRDPSTDQCPHRRPSLWNGA